jgi:hypothetical protein
LTLQFHHFHHTSPLHQRPTSMSKRGSLIETSLMRRLSDDSIVICLPGLVRINPSGLPIKQPLFLSSYLLLHDHQKSIHTFHDFCKAHLANARITLLDSFAHLTTFTLFDSPYRTVRNCRPGKLTKTSLTTTTIENHSKKLLQNTSLSYLLLILILEF